MTRTIQQIIESEQEPTDEERAELQPLFEALWERRQQRMQEYAQQPDYSGYALSLMFHKVTLDEVRQQVRAIMELGLENLTKALESLDAFARDLKPELTK